MNEKIYLEGINSVSALIKALDSGCARRKIVSVFFDETKIKKEFRRRGFLKSASERLGFVYNEVPAQFIDEIAEGKTHGGIIAEVTRATVPELIPESIPEKGFCAFIEGAEDPYTLGSCIRSLWSFGADMLIIPHRIPDGADCTLARSSAGMSELLPIYTCSPESVVQIFNDKGYRTLCAGIRDSVPADSADLSAPVLLVVGGEKRGISHTVSEKCMGTIRIPYGRDFMGSLSTASALSVLAYEIMKKNQN